MKLSKEMRSAAVYLAGCLVLAALLTACSSPPPPPTSARMDDVLGSSSVTVYPPAVVSGTITYDNASAPILADFLRKRTTGSVVVSSEQIRGRNEQFATPRPAWEIVRDSVRAHLAIYPLKTDYGAWAAYVFTPGTNQASDVQVILFDRQGNVVRRFDVRQFTTPPHSPAECTDLVMAVIQQREAIAKTPGSGG